MKPILTEQQHEQFDALSKTICEFVKTLNLKVYSTMQYDYMAELANEIGMEQFLYSLRDSQQRGYYNNSHIRFVYNPLNKTLYSFDTPLEPFAILRNFY